MNNTLTEKKEMNVWKELGLYPYIPLYICFGFLQTSIPNKKNEKICSKKLKYPLTLHG